MTINKPSENSLSQIHHDMGQPLSSLKTFSRLLKERPQDDLVLNEFLKLLPKIVEKFDSIYLDLEKHIST